MTIGFVGLGVMGQPMARNLLDAGAPLTVWNRSPKRAADLVLHGAVVAIDVAQVFAASRIVIVMLADDRAVDAVLGREDPSFPHLVAGRTLVNMGTVPPAYSARLAADVTRHGGHYVEAPVSGSRGPAEDGSLVAMLAGDPTIIALLEPILAPMCSRQVPCGQVPRALLTKLAVNLHLITLVTGLVEALHFAERQGLDLEVVADVLAAGPMSSPVARAKTDKVLQGDLTPQAQARDVLYNCQVIVQAARDAGLSAPLLDVCESLYKQTDQLGHGLDDMVAVRQALRAGDRPPSGTTPSGRLPADVPGAKPGGTRP